MFHLLQKPSFPDEENKDGFCIGVQRLYVCMLHEDLYGFLLHSIAFLVLSCYVTCECCCSMVDQSVQSIHSVEPHQIT